MNLEIVWAGGRIKSIIIMWNILTILFCVIALIFNSFGWFNYRKKADPDIRQKEGWNSFYIVSTILIIVVLLSRIDKLI